MGTRGTTRPLEKIWKRMKSYRFEFIHSTPKMGPQPMFSFCGLYLVLLAFVPATRAAAATTLENAKIAMNPKSPQYMLHGEYYLEESDYETYRPTWASVWKIDPETDLQNGEFHISFWPPKYCHAIYICPTSKIQYSDTEFFTTNKGHCEYRYIKYYPHVKKMLLKADSNSKEEEKKWMSNRIEFLINDKYEADVRVLETEPKNYEDWREELKKSSLYKINLADSDLLVLTNSRMCQVNKPGSKFYPFFRTSIQEKKDPAFPKWLHDGSKYVHSDSLPAYQSSGKEKTVDVLAYIKDLQWSDGKVGNLNMECNAFDEADTEGRPENPNAVFRSISVHTHGVNLLNSNFNQDAYKEFTLSVPSCHWFRIWATKPAVTMKDYNTQMKLTDTIDVFVNEGFYISPESNIAHPLPSIVELTKFTFRAQYDDSTKTNLVEMSYGDVQGKRIYFELFKMPIMQEPNFNLHILKAPGCNLAMESEFDAWGDGTGLLKNHMWDISTCKYSFFKSK